MSDFRCNLLVIPYKTVLMEYYPGIIINSSSIDYRNKIIKKGSEISKAGTPYFQKAIEVESFTVLAFLKIDEKQVEDSLRLGVTSVLRIADKCDGPVKI